MIDELIEIYHKESWHTKRLSDDELRKYYESMIAQDRIIACMDNDRIIGVCEFARLNLSQLGYVMISDSISPDIHDDKGTIVYIISLYITPSYRGTEMISYLKSELERMNPTINFFAGETQGKNRKIWHIYKRSGKEAIHGKN